MPRSAQRCPKPRYAALIRAHEATPLLTEAVEKLRAQTAPPRKIIIVDSSRDPDSRAEFDTLADVVVPYPEGPFNFSRALNIGVAASDCEMTLAISSHILLDDPALIEKGWAAARAKGAEIVFWTRAVSEADVKRMIIDRRSFNGRNGIGNSTALYPTEHLKARPFREEVFAAEDQEWTLYYLRRFGRPVLRIETLDLRYLNPNHCGETWSHAKILNEELAIGHFVNRRLIMPDRILARVARGILAKLRRRPDRAGLHFGVAKAMLMANFRPPDRQSRYF